MSDERIVEDAFQKWYADRAAALGLNPNPDDPQHFYDYRAAFRAGAEPDQTGHWPSQFKLEGHPRMVIDGVNTKTGERVAPQSTYFDSPLSRPKVSYSGQILGPRKYDAMEPVINTLGGIASMVPAGLGGLATALNPFLEEGRGADMVNWLQNELAPQPRTQAGAEATQRAGAPMDAFVHGYAPFGVTINDVPLWPGTERIGAGVSDFAGPAVGAGTRTALEFGPSLVFKGGRAVGGGAVRAGAAAARGGSAILGELGKEPIAYNVAPGQAGKVGGGKKPPAEPAILATPGEPPPAAGESAILKAPVEDWDMLTPEEQQALVQTHKRAGLPPPEGAQPGAVGLIDWKAMTPAERQAGALADIHVKQMPDGKIVGSPDLTDVKQLDALRTNMYDFVRGLTQKPWMKSFAPWYERQRQGVEEASGPDPAAQHTLAQGIGVYSPQSTPATNFTSAINQAAHYAVTGDPSLHVRTRSQTANFGNQVTGTAEATQGPKTGPFSESSDPTGFDPHMSTNDIWIGRLFGYDEGKFSRGFTPQEHGFVQGEMQRLVAVANKEKWGGRADWTAEEMQAIPWIELKAQSLMKKRGLSYEAAIQEAMNTTLEALPRNTTYLPNEMIPGKAAQHIPALLDAPEAVKLDYTNAPGNFLDPVTKRNVLWQSLPGAYERQAVPFQGSYWNSAGQREGSPGIGFRPLTVRLAGRGGTISPKSQYALDVMQGIHGLFNVQEGSTHTQFFPWGAGMNLGDINAAMLRAPEGRAPISTADLTHLEQSGKAVGLPDSVHFGGGDVMLTNFKPRAKKPTTAQRQQMTAAVLPGTRVQFGRQQAGKGVWLSDEWAQPQGSGAVTSRILDLLSKDPVQSSHLLEAFDANPEVLKQIGAMNPRDVQASQSLSTPLRADVVKLRDDVVKKFGSLTAFFDHVAKYGTVGYPAAAVAYLMRQAQQEPSQ